MPQPPHQVDAVQIEPGTTTFGTRQIDRDPVDGGLRFADPNTTAALQSLVGIRNFTDVYIVGPGDAADYATIQEALDAAPTTGTQAAPILILISPGTYTENLTINKDGIVLAPIGSGVRITNNGSADTITLAAAIASQPRVGILTGITVINTVDAFACIRILGADQFASGTATVVNTPLVAGDTLTIGGTVLTGTASVRTPGSDDFQVTGGTTDAIAAEISAALNDPANSFASTIQADVAGAVITITAITAGAGGNSITLAANTTPGGGITVSGGTLTGGGADGSTLYDQGLTIRDCFLTSSGAGGFHINADTSNITNVFGDCSFYTDQVPGFHTRDYFVHVDEFPGEIHCAPG